MGAFFFSIAVTAVLAIAAKVWLGGADLRLWDEMREWAADAGWQVRSSEDDARWPLPPSTYGSQLIAVDGRRDGYDVAVVLADDGESLRTACHVRLGSGRPAVRLRRRTLTRWVAAADAMPFDRRYLVVEGSDLALSEAVREAIAATSIPFFALEHDHLTASEQDWVSPAELDRFVDATLSVARAVEAR